MALRAPTSHPVWSIPELVAEILCQLAGLVEAERAANSKSDFSACSCIQVMCEPCGRADAAAGGTGAVKKAAAAKGRCDLCKHCPRGQAFRAATQNGWLAGCSCPGSCQDCMTMGCHNCICTPGFAFGVSPSAYRQIAPLARTSRAFAAAMHQHVLASRLVRAFKLEIMCEFRGGRFPTRAPLWLDVIKIARAVNKPVPCLMITTKLTVPQTSPGILMLEYLDVLKVKPASPDALQAAGAAKRWRLVQPLVAGADGRVLPNRTITRLAVKFEDFSLGVPPVAMWFAGLTRIKIQHSRLAEWPAFVADMPSLTEVNFNFNDIKWLPDTLPPQIKHVKLAENRITYIPPAFLKHVVVANLSHNAIRAVRLELPHTVELDLCSNALAAYPVFGYAPVLVALYVSYNAIGAMLVGDLPVLRTCQADNCNLTQFVVVNCPKLAHLFISDNMLAHLPAALESSDIWEIDASNNKIARLFSDSGAAAGARMKNLRILGLGGNLIADFPAELLGMPFVKINLKNNPLEKIPREVAFRLGKGARVKF